MSTQLKKMTLKTIVGLARGDDAKAYFAKRAKTGDQIAAIGGLVTGYASKAGQYGENHYFIGDFVAKNMETGELFESSKIFLPKDTAETIIARFDSREDKSSAVEFKLTVTVIEDAASAVGYTYLVSPIRDAEEVNRRAQLLSGIASVQKALPAPQKKKA